MAQSDTLRWHQGLKLKSSHFSINPATTQVFADVVIHYEYTVQPLKAGKYLPIVHSFAILNRATASLPDSSEWSLRYAQLIFDLSGYQSRLIEWKAFELGELSGKDASIKTAMDRIFFEAENEISRLRKDMIEQLSGRDYAQRMAEWETKIADLLHATPEVMEEKTVGNFQIGLFAGITRSIFAGKTKDHFTDATGVNYGFNLDLKRSRFGLDMNLGLNQTRKRLESRGDWPAAMKTHWTSIELTYGIKIPRGKWLSVPYVGLGINEFSPARSSQDDRRRVDGYSPVVGLELNRIFKTNSNPKGHVFFFYRIRASVNPSNFIKKYSGTQLNLKIAVGVDAARVRSRLVKKASFPQRAII
ncbi:hypothetical protein LX87_05418 [Larkinella arboricola]|uniref:Uncharacterized protein n=1 Tax=Larkinella arboricola TaxID=643671 RepID=A0A327WIR4_LARAB|nr:hypothetical protein [Larkinella arboricola]RAJ90874.1 hypothetical protein LX87_05418 [Larkinella arboricola]